jgi:hypothetical protein
MLEVDLANVFDPEIIKSQVKPYPMEFLLS